MGGLVASTYAATHEDWNDSVQHCIFVGSPLAGSCSAAQTIMGLSESFNKLDRFSVFESGEDFRTMAAGFPGLVDLLPNPDVFEEPYPGTEKLFQCKNWPDGICPSQHALDASIQLKRQVAGSPIFEVSTHLISTKLETIAGFHWNGVPTPFDLAEGGDGTVLSQSAWHERLHAAYHVPGEHGMLCVESDALDAFVKICKGESTVAEAFHRR